MGTRRHPGKYDCAASALDDEPQFTVLARSPEFSATVTAWAILRHERIKIGVAPEADRAMVHEAFECAVAGAIWRIANEGRWRKERIPPQSSPLGETLSSLEIACLARARALADLRLIFLRHENDNVSGAFLLDQFRRQLPPSLSQLAPSPSEVVKEALTQVQRMFAQAAPRERERPPF